MADRNPSKQRRQSQNRAARDARKARAEAANTPIEDRRVVSEPEPQKKRSSRGRRDRRSNDDVQAKARAVIDAAESTAEVDFDETEDSGEEFSSRPAPNPVPAVRRGPSPVFSARHRAEVAEETADRAPARTHVGVAAATGAEAFAPRRASRSASKGSSSRRESVPASQRRPAQPARSRSQQSRQQHSEQQRSRPQRPAKAAPPVRPLPPFLDRFGGNEPGGRWVMLSFVTVLIASIVLNFVHIVPEIVENSKGKKVQTGEYYTIWHYGLGPGLYFLLPPIVILGLFIFTARPWDRRRSWNIALACLVFITFITQSISIYVIPIGCLAWGCWQARKAALDEVGGDPRVLREVEKERRLAGKRMRR